MKIKAILCSPRKNGNTEFLLNEFLEEAYRNGAETEMIRIGEMNIQPCDGCEYCHKEGNCHLDDDMKIIYEKLLVADGIVLGSPVYFWSVSSQTKIFMDRTYALRYPYHRLKNKVCGAIVVAGRRGCMSALSTINLYFLGQDMIPIGLGIAGYGKNKSEVSNDKRACEGARSLARQMIKYIHEVEIK